MSDWSTKNEDGLSVFKRVSGSSTTLVGGAWITVLEVTDIPKVTKITGLKIDLSNTSAVNPAYRITAKRQHDDNFAVVAPHDPTGQTLVSGGTDAFRNPIQIPQGSSYRIQVFADSVVGTEATVDFVNFIEFNP